MSDGGAGKAINPEKANPFSNYSNVALADAMGTISDHIDRLTKRLKAARDLMAARKLSAIEGARYIVSKAVVATHTFDGKAVRAEMGDDWYEARQKDGTRTTYTVTEKPPEELGVEA